MDPIIHVSQPQICSKHNHPILLYNPDPKQDAQCLICIKQKNGLISAQSYLQKLNGITQQETELCNNNLQQIQDLHNSILNYKNSLIVSLDKILQILMDQMKTIRNNKEKLKQIMLTCTDHQKVIMDLQLICENSQKVNEQLKDLVLQQLLDFQKIYNNNIDQLKYQMSQKPKIITKDTQIDKMRFQYQLIQKSCKEEKNACFAFAFNQESSILIVACKKEIIVYQFNEGLIVKEIQRLAGHADDVRCLLFMKQSNSFISGSLDYSIIVWQFNKIQNQWLIQNQLKDQTKCVSCITMNFSEDQLISGRTDKTIKFWTKINSNWTIQETIEANEKVYDIILNEKENKLIARAFKLIKIFRKENDNKWRIIQTINTDGNRLCFTVGDQFVFQPINSDKIEIYDYNQTKEEFEKVQEVQIQKYDQDWIGFPCQYIQKLSIVAIKFGIYLNIFKINTVGKYQLFQTIEFTTIHIYGRLSDDGEYLVTWDRKSEQIIVRRLKCIQ